MPAKLNPFAMIEYRFCVNHNTPFPGRIRMSKIHISIQSKRYLFMLSKFQPIVKGDGLHLIRHIPHAPKGGLGQSRRSLARQSNNPGISRFAFHSGQ